MSSVMRGEGVGRSEEAAPSKQYIADTSDGSDMDDDGWVESFCSLRGNEYFCKVDMEFITDRFNLTGIGHEVPNVQAAYDIIIDEYEGSDEDDETSPSSPLHPDLQYSAKLLYGLIHARYIITPNGLARMKRKFINGEFGTCPRVYCNGHSLIPVGLSDLPRRASVKLYCSHCEDIYNPKSSTHAAIDGAFFGTTFAHLFFQTFPEQLPPRSRDTYVPKIFGFRIGDPQKFEALQKEYQQQRTSADYNSNMQP